MAPTASTLYKQQSRYNGKLTREYSNSGLGTIYWSSAETLGITAGWFQVDAENTKGEELFITGITGTPAEYSGTVSIRGLRDYGADTNVPAKQFVHRATASIIVSDNHSWLDQMIVAFLAHEQLQTAFHGFAGIGSTASRPAAAAGNNGMLYWSSDDLVLYYSNGTTWTAQAAGTQPDASDSVKGVSKLSVAASDPVNPIVVGDNDPRVVTGTTAQRGVFIEASAANIIAGTQTHGSGVELTVNPKFLADASVSTSAGVGDANKYIRLNASGALSNTLTGVSFTAGNSGLQGDLLEVTASDTASSLKRKITKEDNYVLTVTNSGTPDTFGGFVNNLGQKLLIKDATNIMGIYNGDDVVRVFHLEKNTTLNTWSVKYSSSAPTALTGGAINRAFVVNNTADGVVLVGGYNGAGSLVFSRYPNGLTAPSTGVVSASGAAFTTCNLTTNNELVFYDLTGTGYQAVVVNHAGVPALGAVVTISARVGGASMSPGAIKLGANKAFLIFPNSADNLIQGMVVSVSGTTITTNTAQTIESGSLTSGDGVIFAYSLFDNQGIADKAVIVLRRVTGAITAYLIEVSGTTFTATAMTGLTSQNFYGLISSDAVLVGASAATAVGYKIDTTNLKFTQCTNAYSTLVSGAFTGIVYDANQALSVVTNGTTLELANISPTHHAPLVALSAYTNAGTVVATNRGEVTVPAISGSAGDIQYLTFSGTSNTRINEATVLGVAKNATTIILS